MPSDSDQSDPPVLTRKRLCRQTHSVFVKRITRFFVRMFYGSFLVLCGRPAHNPIMCPPVYTELRQFLGIVFLSAIKHDRVKSWNYSLLATRSHKIHGDRAARAGTSHKFHAAKSTSEALLARSTRSLPTMALLNHQQKGHQYMFTSAFVHFNNTFGHLRARLRPIPTNPVYLRCRIDTGSHSNSFCFYSSACWAGPSFAPRTPISCNGDLQLTNSATDDHSIKSFITFAVSIRNQDLGGRSHQRLLLFR